eukprot:5871886-Prymnesium_polylepis.1
MNAFVKTTLDGPPRLAASRSAGCLRGCDDGQTHTSKCKVGTQSGRGSKRTLHAPWPQGVRESVEKQWSTV